MFFSYNKRVNRNICLLCQTTLQNSFFLVSVFGSKIGLWKLLAWICCPISVLKNIISIVQMIGAFATIAAVDIEERSKQK